MKQTPQQKAVASKMRRDHPDMSVRQIVAHLSIKPGSAPGRQNRLIKRGGY
uniref:Uncharacterized protein n=1 Tax=Klebsiella pneumoniae TaxID=573 RepID=A0A8D9ILZ6_KLEPN|nr:hypothetical protein P54MCR8_PROKKA_00053 [Klebsiella pneumoniae]